MKAAIIKDLLLCRSNLKSYLLFVVMFTGVGIATNNPYYATGITMIIPIMCLISTFTMDEYSKWERFALCSSLRREDLVNAKYVLAIILTIVIFFLNLVVMLVMEKDFINAISGSLSIAAVGIIYLSLLQPVIFKFGAEKSRMYMLMILGLPAFIIIGGTTLFSSQLMDLIGLVDLKLLFGLASLFIIGFIIASYFISIRIVEKKDY